MHPAQNCANLGPSKPVIRWMSVKAIHAQESRTSADEKARAIIAELRLLKMGKAADLVEQSVHETLSYYAFPDIHWQKIRTNNPLERIIPIRIGHDSGRLHKSSAN